MFILMVRTLFYFIAEKLMIDTEHCFLKYAWFIKQFQKWLGFSFMETHNVNNEQLICGHGNKVITQKAGLRNVAPYNIYISKKHKKFSNKLPSNF